MLQKTIRSLVTIGLTILIFIGLLTGLNFVVEKVNSTDALSMAQRSTLSMKVNQYKVYNLEDLEFRYVLADVTFSDDDPVNVKLENFYTEDGVVLSEISPWLDIMISKGYDFTRFKDRVELTSKEKKLNTELLIPINRLHDSDILLASEYPLINNIKFNLANEETELVKTIDHDQHYQQMSLGYVFKRTSAKEVIYRVQRADKAGLQRRNQEGQWSPIKLQPNERVVVLGIKAPEGKLINYKKATLKLKLFEEESYVALDGSYRLINAQNIFSPDSEKKEGFMIFVIPFENAYERVNQGYQVIFE